jgi:hypothetical protein
MVSPAPNFGYAPDPPRRAWRKWSLGLAALLLICLMWQCGSALRQGRVLAEPAVQAFHAKLNAGKYEEIYQGADAALTGTGKHDELGKFLAASIRNWATLALRTKSTCSLTPQRLEPLSSLDTTRHSLGVQRLRLSHGLRKVAI